MSPLGATLPTSGSFASHRVVVGLFLGAVFATGSLVLGHREVAPLAIMIAATGVARDWLALGRQRGARSGLPSLVRGLAMLGLSMLIADESGAAIAIAVSYACGALLSFVLNPLPRPITGRVRRVVDGWMLLAVLMAQIYTSIDTILLATFRSTREAGVYAAVYRIPLAWVTVTGLLVSGMLPVTQQKSSEPAAIDSFRCALRRVSAAAACGLLAVTPIAVVLVTPLFGAEYADGRVPLALLLLATAVSTVSAPLGALYLGVGSDRTFALMLSAGAVVNVVANLIAIPTLGMVGAAATTVGSEALVLLFMWRSVRAVLE